MKRRVVQCCLNNRTVKLFEHVAGIELVHVPEAEIYDYFIQYPGACNGLVLGEEIKNPITIAQKIYSNDHELSIAIITNPLDYRKYTQALKFTPFIGNTIQCISNEDAHNLLGKVEEMVSKTAQRRNYSRLKTTTVPLAHGDNSDIIKKEYLDKYFEKAPIGAVLLDNDGLIMAVNECITAIFSREESKILGTNLASLFEAESRQAFEDFISQGSYNNAKQLFERSKGGEEQFLEITIAQIASKNSGYKIAIVNDITEKVRGERQIKNQLQQLESLNRKLTLSNNTLTKTNKELDNFIYTASHDLKAPILNIEGLVKALEKEIKDPEAKTRTILDLIKKSIERFKETIIDLTEISEIQGELAGDIGSVNIGEVVDEVRSLISASITSSEATIKTDFSKADKIVFSKKNLKSIVYNLLTNAIKYRSPERPPVIQISSYPSGQYVVIRVQDNGSGFDLAKKERIFEMFKRLHNHVEGTGVGLYIVKKIVENTGGEIEVESELNKGATFKIFLHPDIAS